MSEHFLETLIKRKADESKRIPALMEPRKFKVLLYNDDYTPMDFVVLVLKRFFHMPDAVAVQLMFKVHYEGKALCGVFTRDIAETKVALVNDYAKANEQPLLCQMESE